MQTFKDIDFQNQKFRIGLMDALTASNVMALIMPKLIDVMEIDKGFSLPTVIKLLPLLAGPDLRTIQTECLKVCCTYVDVAPVPIMMVDGRWGNRELQYDVVKVLTITAHTVIYNLSPFFVNGGLQTILSSLLERDLTQLGSPV